jgi:hypothetical protein
MGFNGFEKRVKKFEMDSKKEAFISIFYALAMRMAIFITTVLSSCDSLMKQRIVDCGLWIADCFHTIWNRITIFRNPKSTFHNRKTDYKLFYFFKN